MIGYSGNQTNLQAYVTPNTTGNGSSTVTNTGTYNPSIPVNSDYDTRNVSISD